MPELPQPKARPHPWSQSHEAAAFDPRSVRRLSTHRYAELAVTSNFTFLTGASHPDELVVQAAALGHQVAAIADANTLAGVVRAHLAAKEVGIPLALGCRLVLTDPPGLTMLVYPTDRAAYGRLCRLLTLGKRRAEKGACHLTLDDVLEHHAGLLAVVMPPGELNAEFTGLLGRLRRQFTDDRLSLACSRMLDGRDNGRLRDAATLADWTGVPLAAVNDVHYHHPSRQALQDVITCIRLGCTIEQAGLALFANAERHLKPPGVMARLFAERSEALQRAAEVAGRAAAFSLDELRYEYPDEVVPPGLTAMQHLVALTWQGAAERYPQGVPGKVRDRIEHEFRLIEDLRYAPYFLTVHDLVRFARSRGILCQGRGAAANSAVCYCLGVTAVDPDRIDVLFERFVSRERNEPPDIDIDFEHERREEVIQYIYGKYGRDRAALTAEVVSYRARSAVRETGKALGLSLDAVDRLAKSFDWWNEGRIEPERLRELGFNSDDPTMINLAALVGDLMGFPRHLSQHVGGFVITRGPLCECVPIENAAMPDRTVIEWDKDDIDALGMLKVDVLGLGMLTCIRKAIELLNAHRPAPVQLPPDHWTGAARAPRAAEDPASSRSMGRFEAGRNLVLASLFDPQARATPPSAGQPAAPSSRPQSSLSSASLPTDSSMPSHGWPLELHTIPAEDPAVYEMISHADTVGVFQIESRAQMSMLPRLRPRCFYDLVIEVAIVRPGPIQGNMVHPYLRRRNGQEPVTYPDARVEQVLRRTLGVPLFQEQAMSLAIVAAGFTPGEADQLRRAIAAWKTRGNKIAAFGERIIKGMVERGYGEAFARQCFEQIKGFSGYGFPESHAASFALLVYASSWLKRHHPATFAAALLNSQPMGFYAPAQIVRDAREHGVEVRPIDINHSRWDCTLEEQGTAVRLGMRLTRGLSQADADAIAAAVERHGPARSIAALQRQSGVRISALRRLAMAEAFGSLGFDRQQALWQVRALRDERLPIFDQGADDAPPRRDDLPAVQPLRRVVHDYNSTGLTLRAHPVSFIRPQLAELGATRNDELRDADRWKRGRRIAVAGLVLVRQRPSTANGVVFMTLEDESGIANLIIRPEVYRRFRRAARHGVLVLARGTIERQGEVVHVLAREIMDVPLAGEPMESRSRDFH